MKVYHKKYLSLAKKFAAVRAKQEGHSMYVVEDWQGNWCILYGAPAPSQIGAVHMVTPSGEWRAL